MKVRLRERVCMRCGVTFYVASHSAARCCSMRCRNAKPRGNRSPVRKPPVEERHMSAAEVETYLDRMVANETAMPWERRALSPSQTRTVSAASPGGSQKR